MHVRFYLDGRKNNQYLVRGKFSLTSPGPRRPLGGVAGIYHVVNLAHTISSSGYVLPRVSAEGIIDFQRAMSHKDLVKHFRRALVATDLTAEQAFFSLANRCAREAQHLRRYTVCLTATYSTWLESEIRTGYHTTTGTTSVGGCGSRGQSACRFLPGGGVCVFGGGCGPEGTLPSVAGSGNQWLALSPIHQTLPALCLLACLICAF